MKSFEVHAKSMDVKGNLSEISDRSCYLRQKEHVIDNWKKNGLCYKVAKNLVG